MVSSSKIRATKAPKSHLLCVGLFCSYGWEEGGGKSTYVPHLISPPRPLVRVKLTVLMAVFWFRQFSSSSDGMRCCRRDWPGLCLFCCYQPSCFVSQQSGFGSFLCMCFIHFPILLHSPPPLQMMDQWSLSAM